MNDLVPTLKQWKSQGKEWAMATVLKTWGSAPRPIGSHMLVSEDMEMAGSVSGGCVEGAVVREAAALIKDGGAKELHYGVSNDEAWEVGLSCGGKLDVWLEKWGRGDAWEALEERLINQLPSIWVSGINEDQPVHGLITPEKKSMGSALPNHIFEKAINAYEQRKNQLFEEENDRWFIRVIPPKSRLLIIGAAHISVDLVSLARMYGFESVVIDPRGLFAQKTTYDVQPDQMLEAYPSEVLDDLKLDAYTYAVVLSHDPKIDDNALHVLLKSNVAYIGALGSRKNQAKRQQRLREAGFSEEEIARVHGPIGVDISARGAKEIALAIMAEIIGEKNRYL